MIEHEDILHTCEMCGEFWADSPFPYTGYCDIACEEVYADASACRYFNCEDYFGEEVDYDGSRSE